MPFSFLATVPPLPCAGVTSATCPQAAREDKDEEGNILFFFFLMPTFVC